MNNSQQLSREILRRMRSIEFLRSSGLHARLDVLPDEPELEGWLAGRLPITGRLSCKALVEGLRPMAARLCKEPLPEDWAAACYWAAVDIAFPGQQPKAPGPVCRGAVSFCLLVLQVLLEEEGRTLPFDPFWSFAFLPDSQAAVCENGAEYLAFKKAWKQEFVYEMLRLCDEVMPYTTLAHVSGVHHIAMLAAGGLYRAGRAVDLAVVSAAAAVHDIGKFGCRPGERVPYLHYYYTSQWCHRLGLSVIGQVAANHSTWDLELENLPGESMCLIYADFRSKQKLVDGKSVPAIFSLKASFEVILSKLDNVDEAKLRRYKLVYSRLQDFEQYLRSVGTDVDETGRPQPPAEPKDIALQSSEELVQTMVFDAVRLDIEMMHALVSDRMFGNILEAARTESDWKHLRAYLDIFREFSTYLREQKKQQLMDFLYELLMHREGDIRHYAADILGLTLAQYHEGYRKQLPDNVEDVAHSQLMELWRQTVERIIRPDHKLADQHIRRIGYTLKLVFASLQKEARAEDFPGFFGVLMDFYRTPEAYSELVIFNLLDLMQELPLGACSEEQLNRLADFAFHAFAVESVDLRTGAARFLLRLAEELPADHPLCVRIAALIEATDTYDRNTTLFLKYRILRRLGRATPELEEQVCRRDMAGEVFLDDLKAGRPWILTAVNIDLLTFLACRDRRDELMHIATHLCNLLKVSEFIGIRKGAGEALLQILDLLTEDQRNEVTVELLKALETGDYAFSKYIPPYLGELALRLPEAQLEEVLNTLQNDLGSANECVVNVALDTVAVMLGSSTDGRAAKTRRRMLGMLLIGLAHYRESVRQNALLLLGRLFADSRLDSAALSTLLGLCLQKVLGQLAAEQSTDQLTRFYRTAALTHIWRFVTTYQIDRGRMVLAVRDKVAFFPGTFDPFTLSHKGIVECIRNLGYEVYLAVDEFSWSKNTQPHLLRRKIINMSVADMFHVHLFPNEIPINIANPADLDRLDTLFAGREWYLVAGSDVVQNASAYRSGSADPRAITRRNHIIFRRAGEVADTSCIRGKVVQLELPEYLEQVSSSLIRENVDSNRDISHMTDPVVQEYIYQRGLYLREPRFKPIQSECSIQITDTVLRDGQIQLALQSAEGCGSVRLRMLRPGQLLEGLHDLRLADYVRSRTDSQLLLVEKLRCTFGTQSSLLLNEAVLYGIERGCGYIVFCPEPEQDGVPEITAMLERQGLTRWGNVWTASLRQPLVLMKNLENALKAPFNTDPQVAATVQRLHDRLQQTMAGLYPGHVVVALSMPLVLQRMVDRITAQNNVPRQPTTPRVLGPAMCVPFGKILRGSLVPNTVTKTLYTDRVYDPTLHKTSIEPFPGYTSLTSQIRAIKSFDRPIILVDDWLDQSGRLRSMLPLLRAEGVEVQQVLLGVVSDHGRDSVADSGIPVDSVYHIPVMRKSFLESTMYPFVGGDAVNRPGRGTTGMEPSINKIYPYAEPNLPDCSMEAKLRFSRCCLECARELFLVLERAYRETYGRNLTLSRLNEAVVLPVLPDRGACMQYTPSLSPSVYVENDLQMLNRSYGGI